MNDGYAEHILQRLSALSAQQDRQTEKLTALRYEVASLVNLQKRIDERLEQIERRQIKQGVPLDRSLFLVRFAWCGRHAALHRVAADAALSC